MPILLTALFATQIVPVWQKAYLPVVKSLDTAIGVVKPKLKTDQVTIVVWRFHPGQATQGLVAKRNKGQWFGSRYLATGTTPIAIPGEPKQGWETIGKWMLKNQIITFPDQSLLPKDKIKTSKASDTIVVRIMIPDDDRRFGFVGYADHPKRYGEQMFGKMIEPALKFMSAK